MHTLLTAQPARIRGRRLQRSVLIVASIAAVSVITYLPAVDNFFISDDFYLLPFVEALGEDPLRILDAPSELFRFVSYIYFWICLQAFGLNPEPYYWSGIALHAAASLLVYLLVREATGSRLAAWSAAVFFAAYERHHEAVMWISAVNDAIVGTACLVFLILWRRAHFAAALVAFAVALFSKESATALAPLAAFSMALSGYSARQVFRKTLPLFVMVGAHAALWLSLADRNFFVTGGHYALGWHFFPVYVRTLVRLAAPIIPFAAALLLLRRRGAELGRKLAVPCLFFGALMTLAIAPYTFLTYLDHIPSRNTYFPSVGLAGIVGVLFAGLYGELNSVRAKRAWSVFLAAVLAANIMYIWIRKEDQFRERSAPTRELIHVLNTSGLQPVEGRPVCVAGLPLYEFLGMAAVDQFTGFKASDVVFVPTCEGGAYSAVLRWDPEKRQYVW